MRTVGGHRRVPFVALTEFLEKTNRQLIDPSALGIPVVTPERDRSSIEGQAKIDESEFDSLRQKLQDALISGDDKTCRKILLEGYSICHSFAPIADLLIANAFQQIGNLWACNEVQIYEERRGCEICSQLIHEFRRLVAEPSAGAPLAIGGAPSPDPYTLPNQLIELVLRESGWRATNLGANLPFDSLLAAANRYQPKLFWLSVSHIENEDSFVEGFQHFSSHLPRDIVLVVGGRALHDGIRPRLKFTAHCDSMIQLNEFSRAVRGVRPSLQASQN